MFNRFVISALFSCLVLTCRTGNAQNLCPPGVQSDKLICLVPQVYGPSGLTLSSDASYPSGTSPALDFASSSLRPVNSAIIAQAAVLPLASPSSGITFKWDPAAKVFSPTSGSLGPVLSERAETLGRNKVFVAFDYQFFKFNTVDGLSLKNLPVVFTQPDNTDAIPGQTCSVNSASKSIGPCSFIRDVIIANSRLDLKVHQFITVVTFGLTNRIDVSTVIPIADVHMAVSSTATIINNSNSPFHTFDNRPGCGTATTNCLSQQFSSAGTASGVADMTMRVKGTAWKGEHAALALGADIRFPTGDAQNYLGAGAAGVKPFVAWSRSSRISPHALVGYEVNGSSVIVGDILTGSKERLPSELDYSGGADVWITRQITVAADLVGQQVFQARRLSPATFTEPAACSQPYPFCNSPFLPANTDPALSRRTGALNISSVSIGAKWKPFSTVLITGNALIRVNDGGLKSSVAPLVGVSYTF